MRNIRIKKKRLNQIIKEENFRAYHSLRPLSGSQKRAIYKVSLAINESTGMSAEEAGKMVGDAIGSGISAVGQITADQIRNMNNSGMTSLLGDAFITTLRVDVMRFLLKMIGLDGRAGEFFSQSLASIKISEWPEIIDTWETNGCDIVADALARGVLVNVAQMGSGKAVEIAGSIPLIGNDIKDLLGKTADGKESRLIRVIRQMGVESVDNIEGFDAIKSKLKDEICSIDIKNINAGNIEQLKAALLGLAIPGISMDKLKDSAASIASNSPQENAAALGNEGAPVEDIDDNLGDTVKIEPSGYETSSDYDSDYFSQLADIAEQSGIFPDDVIDELEQHARDLAR